jgi:hypothetical protein
MRKELRLLVSYNYPLKQICTKINAIKILSCVIMLMLGYEIYAAQVTFNPSFGLEESYNENIFYLDIYKASDFVATLNADFPFEFSNPSTKLTLRYSPFTEYYKRYGRRNYTGHYFESIYAYKGKIADIRISDAFSYKQSQGFASEFQEFPVNVLPRTDITSNNFNVAHRLRIRNISFINLDLNHWFLKYKDIPASNENPSYDFEDTALFSSSIENLFALKGIDNQIGYFYHYRKFLYETIANQESHSIGFVYKYEYPEKAVIVVKAGVYKISEKKVIQNIDYKPTFYFDILKTMKRSRVKLGLSRDAGITRGIGEISTNDRLYLRFDYNITNLSSFEILSEYFRRKSIKELSVGLEPFSLTAFAINSSFDFRIFKKASFAISHRYLIQYSKESDFYDSRFNVYSFSVILHPF